jgi:hypothetical protein
MDAPMEYRAVLIERPDQIVFWIQELGIYASGKDVASAYAALRQRYESVVADAQSAGMLDELPPPLSTHQPVAATPSTAPGLKSFALKTGIVVVFLMGGLSLAGFALAGTVNRLVDRTTHSIADTVHSVADTLQTASGNFGVVGGKKFWTGVEEKLADLADPKNEIPVERRARIVAELQVLTARVKPFTDAFSPLFVAPRPQAECVNPGKQ